MMNYNKGDRVNILCGKYKGNTASYRGDYGDRVNILCAASTRGKLLSTMATMVTKI